MSVSDLRLWVGGWTNEVQQLAGPQAGRLAGQRLQPDYLVNPRFIGLSIRVGASRW